MKIDKLFRLDTFLRNTIMCLSIKADLTALLSK